MKRFLKRALLFLMAFVALFSLAFFIQPDRLYHYRFLDDSCIVQAEKIYHRIYEVEKEVDWLFLGSSRTMHAVNDQWINNYLHPAGDSGRVSNMGFCRYGRDLHTLFLQDVLQTNQPRNLVLEVRYQENLYSHPVFPFLATTEDIFDLDRPLHKHLVKNMYQAWRVRMAYGFSYLAAAAPSEDVRATGLYGYASSEIIASLQGMVPKHPSEVAGRPKRMHQFPNYYLNRIAQYCEEYEVALIFLYVPNYRNQFIPPAFSKEYKAWGELWLPPEDLLTDTENWMDETHLNDQGAELYSDWLLEKMLIFNEEQPSPRR